MKQAERLSRAMSQVLRHKAVACGLEVSEDGFVDVDALLALPQMRRLGATPESVASAVAACSKKRFELRGARVRACQGHSGEVAARLSDERMLEEVRAPVECCVHGTYWDAWEGGIRREGLSRMRRRHVHFSSRPYGSADTISGMRASCQVLVHVDVAAAREAGLRFFRSANGVLLTEGDADGFVRPQFFARVEAVGPDRVPRPLRLGPPAADVYVALDFEATCDDDRSFDRSRQEIVEFPMVAVAAASGRTLAEFHSYVRPRENPRLTRFCTRLTGIRQATVDAAPEFGEVWRRACEWLGGVEREHGSVVLVTCGDWDLKTCLPTQLRLLAEAGGAQRAPRAFCRWLNIKRETARSGLGKARGLDDVMRRAGLRFEGRPHSGIDDTRNVARAVARLLRRGCPLDGVVEA